MARANHLLCNSISHKDRARSLWCPAPEWALYFPGCRDRDWHPVPSPAQHDSPVSCSRLIWTTLSPRRSSRADTFAFSRDWRFPVVPTCAALLPHNPRRIIPRQIYEWILRVAGWIFISGKRYIIIAGKCKST